MPRYNVVMPIVGWAEVVVEAEDTEAATIKAMDKVTMGDFGEWEAVRQVVSGNVLHAPVRAVTVDELDEED